jgi:cytochrome c biogenesis protein CcmG/thiol:disulfide interchange protein DsbE
VTGRLRLGAQVVAVGVVAALLGLLLWKVVKGDDNAVTGSLAKGELVAAPDWDLALLSGDDTLALESLRGKAVVLNFWASWCGPCKDETPLLQKGWLRWEGKDVVFVGMNVKDFRGDARSFVRRFGVTYPNVYDGKGSTVGRYGVTGFPETYFIDANGRVVYRIAGPVADAEELDGGIRRALAPA